MATVSGVVAFDFPAARERVVKLVSMYRRLKRLNGHPDNLAWIASEISCIEMEIEAARKNETTGPAADRSVQASENNLIEFSVHQRIRECKAVLHG